MAKGKFLLGRQEKGKVANILSTEAYTVTVLSEQCESLGQSNQESGPIKPRACIALSSPVSMQTNKHLRVSEPGSVSLSLELLCTGFLPCYCCSPFQSHSHLHPAVTSPSHSLFHMQPCPQSWGFSPNPCSCILPTP